MAQKLTTSSKSLGLKDTLDRRFVTSVVVSSIWYKGRKKFEPIPVIKLHNEAELEGLLNYYLVNELLELLPVFWNACCLNKLS